MDIKWVHWTGVIHGFHHKATVLPSDYLTFFQCGWWIKHVGSLTHSQVKKNHCGGKTPSQVSNRQCSSRVTVKNSNLDLNLRLLSFPSGPSLQGAGGGRGREPPVRGMECVWDLPSFLPPQPNCTSHFSDSESFVLPQLCPRCAQ